ncbi:diaminopimelate epimerase [Bacillus shivajii]|uniref:diaminopimelate epimerase n=1 Tax=Bacillus shivajii TaxID=1983719 RepID=UPI001CF9D3F3|nr:diaminopimelate epimerase [Bacillus shivajii]UCZ52535.1 diaminopimelate epimerase [Bacillus shivajii]
MRFTKMHGLGNQYIFVNTFKESLHEEELQSLAVEVSNIHTGIGSDGMILIGPSDVAHVQMRVFNKDGSEAKNCGNGLRCVAKYAYENELVQEKTMQIETLGGVVTATVETQGSGREVDLITVDMGEPILTASEIPLYNAKTSPVIQESIQAGESPLKMTAVSMGNPHAVFFVHDIEEAPLTTLGPLVEKHERFPDGVNVEFIEVVSPNELNFQVWERGSGVTEACGTGACAAVVASILNERSPKGEEVVVHLAGGDLSIKWDVDDRVWMTGPAETICEGTYYKRAER